MTQQAALKPLQLLWIRQMMRTGAQAEMNEVIDMKYRYTKRNLIMYFTHEIGLV